jgi:hypothetical protein
VNGDSRYVSNRHPNYGRVVHPFWEIMIFGFVYDTSGGWLSPICDSNKLDA